MSYSAQKRKSGVTSLRFVQKKLSNLTAILKGEVIDEFKKGGEAMAEEAKQMAPILTGKLRNSIRSRVIQRTDSSIKIQISFNAKNEVGFDYGAYLHGTPGGAFASGWNLGTISEQQAESYKIGWRFLERAAEKIRPKITKKIQLLIHKEMIKK